MGGIHAVVVDVALPYASELRPRAFSHGRPRHPGRCQLVRDRRSEEQMPMNAKPESQPNASIEASCVAGIEDLLGESVVVDTDSRFVYLGRLAAVHAQYVRLEDVDVHECVDLGSAKERYILEARKIGVRPTRKAAWINGSRLVSISRLSDVEAF